MDTYGSGTGRDVSDMVEKLGDLLRLDVDAVNAYNEAIEKIESSELRSSLSEYRDDHQRHVRDLTVSIERLGHQAPEPSGDFKGKLIEGMTKLRSSMGDEQAMKAMHQNEEITNKAYSHAAAEAWPTDILDVVEQGFADERRHLQWIEQRLSVGVGAQDRGAY